MKKLIAIYLLFCAYELSAQIPGTVTVTGPIAPPATNSPFGATDTRWQKGGYNTWATNLSQLQSLTWLPAGRREAGAVYQLKGGSKYVLAPDLVTFIPQFLNAKDFGVVADGVTDDSATLLAFAQAATNGSTVYYPYGKYRVGTQGSAIWWRTNLSNIKIMADPGTEFLMENLSNGVATSSAFRITGPATNVTFSDLHVRWTVAPTNRALSSIYTPFAAWNPNGTDDTGTDLADTTLTAFIKFENCTAVNGPGLGWYIAGVKYPTLINCVVSNTLADGYYIHNVENATILNCKGFNLGDDGLSIMHEETDLATGEVTDPYHGQGSIVMGLLIQGLATNAVSFPAGVLIGGQYGTYYSDIVVRNYPIGLRVFYGRDPVPSAGGFPFLAARDVKFSNFYFQNVQQGIVLQLTTNSIGNGQKWIDGDVTITDGVIDGTNTNFMLSQMWNPMSASQNTDPAQFRTFSGVHLQNVRALCGPNTYCGVYGPTNFVWDNVITDNRFYFTGPYYDSTLVAKTNLPVNNLIVRNFSASTIGIQGINRATFENVMSLNSPGSGFELQNLYRINFGRMVSKNAQQTPEGAYSLSLQDSQNISIESLLVDQTTPGLGGGIIETNNTSVNLKDYVWTGEQYTPDIYGAFILPAIITNWNVGSVRFLNRNETNAIWRSYNMLWNNLGVGKIATNGYALDVVGNPRFTGPFSQIVWNDDLQSISAGGMARLINYGAGVHFGFNTSASGDFATGKDIFQMLFGGALSPGSDNAISLGSTGLLWSDVNAYRFSARASTAYPTASDLADITFQVWHNTVSGRKALYTASGGTIYQLTPSSGSATLDFGNILAGQIGTMTVTVAGAAVGDVATSSPRTALAAGLAISYVRISAADTIEIGILNSTALAIDPASNVYDVRVQP